MIPVLALTSVQILGIIIAGVILVGVALYFVLDTIKNKRFIKAVEQEKIARDAIDAEKEEKRAQYRAAKKVGDEFLADSDKEVVLKEFNKNKPSISKFIKNIVSVEDTKVLNDETLAKLTPVVHDKKEYSQKIRTITVTTTQLNGLDNDLVVNPVSLIEKGIIPKYEHYSLHIQAKAPLKKALIVEAHEFDNDAAKMILLAGGSIIKVEAYKK